MWRLEVDPWFQSSFGALTVLDGPIDLEYLQARLLTAVARIPRLRQRIIERPGENPGWQTDAEFDLDHHLRSVGLPAPGDERQLLDFACRVVADPLDRTRPLWQFHVIEGLPNGRTAVLTKLHHSLTDGEGGVQIALEYMDLSQERTPVAPTAELEDELRILLESEAPAEATNELRHTMRDAADRQLGRFRSVLGEAAMYAADPRRITEQAGDALGALRRLSDDLPSGEPTTSLWGTRSRHRHLEHVGLDLQAGLAAARQRGGTLNDLLLTAVSAAADSYHAAHEIELDRLQGTFIISTRDDSTGVGNAFSPSPVELPGAGLSLDDRFALIAGRTEEAKQAGTGRSELQTALAGPARFIPASALAAFGRRQARRVDVAMSNLRSAPIPLWVGGAGTAYNVPIGPVAGTACNITLMSYADRADIGLHIDPAAIDSPSEFRACIASAIDELLAGSN